MNRGSAVLFAFAAVCVVAGAALFSPRLAVLVAGACFAVSGAALLDVKDRR